jgi:tetratricopeptide (TPR) repeat protein
MDGVKNKIVFSFIFPLLLIVGARVYAQEKMSSNVALIVQDLKDKEGKYYKDKDVINSIRVRHKMVTQYSKYLSKKEKGVWNIKLGESYYEIGGYLLAIDHFKLGLTKGVKRLDSYTNARLGSCYIELNQLDSAITRYKMAVQFADNPESRMQQLNSLGYVYFLSGNLKEANKSYSQALNYFSSNKIDSIQYYIVQSNLGSVSMTNSDDASAIYAFNKCLSWVLKQKEHDWFEFEVRGKLIDVLVKKGDCELANEHVGQIRRLMAQNESISKVKGLEFCVRWASSCGDKSTLVKFVNEKRKSDEIALKIKHANLLIVEKLQRNMLKRQIALANSNARYKTSEAALLAVSNSRLSIVFVISGVGFLVVIGGLIWIVILNKRKQKRRLLFEQLEKELLADREKMMLLEVEVTKEKLENKKLELKQILSSTNNQFSILEEVQKKLKLIASKENDVSDDLKQVNAFISSRSSADQISEIIRDNYNDLGINFKEIIQEKYSSLSESELDLLVLIRIGLSNKEMAQLKNVEPSSIRMFKYRIKQKLNLSKDTSLKSFVDQNIG